MNTNARIPAARILIACAALGVSLSAVIAIAASPWGTTETVLGAAAVSQDPSPGTNVQQQRRQADDLLRRARQAMEEGDLRVAESLVSQAEALGVKYSVLHFGDTPKKARRDLQRQQKATTSSPVRPSQIFSALGPKKEGPPSTDPFTQRNDAPLPDRTAELAKKLSLDGAVEYPAFEQRQPIEALPDPSQFPPTPFPAAPSPSFGSPAGMSLATDAAPAATGPANPLAGNPIAGNPIAGNPAAGPLLLEARRALAVGDIRRANDFVARAKTLNATYQPADDTPQKAEAAIRKYQDLISQPSDTEAYYKVYARTLMEQADSLLQAGDLDTAEKLTNSATDWSRRHRINFGMFETKPADVQKKIDAARASSGPSSLRIVSSQSPGIAGPSLAARQKADALVRQARTALNTGQLDQAEKLARQAEQLGIPSSAYAPGEDRAGLVLFDIRQQQNKNGSGVIAAGARSVIPATGATPATPTASPALYDATNDSTRNVAADFQSPPQPPALAQNTFPLAPIGTQPPVQPPPPPAAANSSADGMSLFRQGEAALRAHDKQRAYELFRQADTRKHELDPNSQQLLQSRLQLLSPSSSGQPSGQPARSPIDDAAARQHALARQIANELTGEQAKARAMLESDPNGAVALLKEARVKVESASLEPGNRDQLLRRVDRHIRETEQFIRNNGARIELDERNRQTRERIDRKQQVKLEIQEEMAQMVNEFNRLMDEERFEEAEVIAKRAAERDPDSPIVKQLVLHAKFVRRNIENLRLRDRKEGSFLGAMDAVEDSAVGFGNDNERSIIFPDAQRWQDITDSRSRRFLERNRLRTEREIELEQKLKMPVPSMQFENEPLSSVLDHLQQLTAVNMHVDPEALEEYQITSDTPITIKLQSEIMLKSVLNLILDPLHLTYVIKDEVLKITTERQREGETYTVTYSVADLVVPIPNFVASPRMGLAGAYHDAMANAGFGGGSPFGTATTPLAVVASRDGSQNSAAINPGLLAQMSAGGATGAGSMPMGFGGPGGLGGGSQADFDSLIELIQSTIQPTTWDEVGGPGSIAEFDTNLSLVVSQTQDVHEEIVDLLEQLRRLQDLQVTIEVRFITLNDNFFERVGVDFDFDINDDTDRPYQVFGRKLPDDDGDPTTGTEPTRNTLDQDHDRSVTVGMQSPGVFSADLDIPFTQNSFGLSVPQFGGFDASAGASLGFAILSDIEAFFFINAAQGDRRSNVLQAPKVTLFNGQQAFVSDTSQSPFVVSVIPVVGDFAAAQQPVIVVLSEGTLMTVQAVVSQDRRFVRLTVVPFFSQIDEVNEFQFTGSSTTTTDTSTDGVVDPENADPNSATSSTANRTTSRNGTTVQLPTFSYVTVTTTVSVPDGGTVLLGGIKRLSEGRNEFGVPILNKVPYLNRLFKNVGIGRETQSLMMMVTPRIIIQEEEEERLGIGST